MRIVNETYQVMHVPTPPALCLSTLVPPRQKLRLELVLF